MPTRDPSTVSLNYLHELQLKRLDAKGEAGLLVTSLPWPATEAKTLTLGGRPTYQKALGEWPEQYGTGPRRLLLIGDGGEGAPDTLGLVEAIDRTAPASAECPTASMTLFARSTEESFVWERHLLDVHWGERTIGLALGLRTGGEVHWWEACRLVVEEETPECRTIHMAGSIPVEMMTHADMAAQPGYGNRFLHHHNWLSGHLYLRLHANGVCEVFARHINSKFFDDGLELRDVVPVIGIRCDRDEAPLQSCPTEWDGSTTALSVREVAFDMTETARLATPAEPGRLDWENSFLVLQPYAGVDVFGGVCPEELTGDPWVWRAKDRVFPRGMARSLRFSFSLSDRSPRVVRYLPPHWWYGINRELASDAKLPVSNVYDERLDGARDWLRWAIVKSGFEDGSVPRGAQKNGTTPPPHGRHEPGWEGEIPFGQFLLAYRTGEAEDYHHAMRSAYHFTDVAVDHAAKLVRMHGFPPPAVAQPMNRMLGTIAAYLETGDPYLRNTAEAVIETAFRMHQNSWPRIAVGRDACFARGAAMLYRYFNNPHFRRMAYEGAMSVVQSQREDGSFGDQAGGTGIHQWGAYITKPWMGLLSTAAVLDYLDLFPEETSMAACIEAFGNWLMNERWERDGVTGWSYQHAFNGGRKFFNFKAGEWTELPGSKALWHQDNLARVLLFCARRTGRTDYIDAWAESAGRLSTVGGDHSSSAALQYLPGFQMRLWNAELPEPGRIRVTPLHFGPRTPETARIVGPNGEIELQWRDDGTVAASNESVEVQLAHA